MRWIAGVIFSLSTFSLNAQDEYPNVLERDSFPGVKSLVITGYLLELGEENDTMLMALTQAGYTFNESGAWVTKGGLFPDGNTTFDSIWYDEKTRTKYIHTQNDFAPSLTTITYNASGKVISELYAPESGEQVLKEYEYDKSGRLIRHSETIADLKIVNEYIYDKKGRIISTKESNGSIAANTSGLKVESFNTYNKSGLRKRSIAVWYDAAGTVSSHDTTFYEYDGQKRLVLQRESRGNGKSRSTTAWEYDEKGRVTLRVYKYTDRDGNYDEVTTTAEYDAFGYCKHFTDNGTGDESGLSWSTTYN